MKLNILHLSDLHYNKEKHKDIDKVIKALFRDIKKLNSEHGLKPDLVFFTGDLINKGQNASEELNLALSSFIIPLLDELQIDDDKFFIVPGNHEVNLELVSTSLEDGLERRLYNLEEYTKYHDSEVKKTSLEFKTIQKKLEAYFDFKTMLGNRNLHKTTFFYDVYKVELKKFKVGLIGLNSAWLCGKNKERKLIIGENMVEEATDLIDDCDLKIALSHHPFEMLTHWDKNGLQRLMAKKIDLYCTGHIHSSDFLYFRPILGSMCLSSCGSLFMGRISEGYSLLSVDLLNKQLNIYLRKWYKEREEFDQETEKCERGLIIFENFKCNNQHANELIGIHKIKTELLNSLNENSLIIPLENVNEVKLDDVFVEPLISNTPSFNRESEHTNYFSIEELLKIDTNLIFYGGKEYGKTTLLNYIKIKILEDSTTYEDRIPAVIPFEELPKNNVNSVAKNILVSLEGMCTKEEVEGYLHSGKIVILVDDYDDYNDDNREKRKKTIYEFYNQYPKCKYIFATNEKIGSDFKQDSLQLAKEYSASSFYLYPFNTAKIRELLARWNKYSNFDANKMLEQVIYYFKQLQIPVTPTAITLFIGVLFKDMATKKNIRNEAYLIENYLEKILKKLNMDHENINFDFKDKESFLSHIAFRMVERDEFVWDKNDFEQEKLNYFENYGEDVPRDSEVRPFFDKGILKESHSKISFKFRFWFHFFLAKSMQNDSSKKQFILEKSDYLKYSTALGYKSGLARNDKELLMVIDQKIRGKLPALVQDVFTEEIKTDSSIETALLKINDKVEETIKEKDSKVKDLIKDDIYLNYDADNQNVDEEQYNNIVNLITLNSIIVRNTSEITIKEKQEYLKNNVEYYIKMMLIALKGFKEMIEEIDSLALKEFFETKLGSQNQVDMKMILIETKKIVLRILPLSVITYMVNQLANPRLKNCVLSLLENEYEFNH